MDAFLDQVELARVVGVFGIGEVAVEFGKRGFGFFQPALAQHFVGNPLRFVELRCQRCAVLGAPQGIFRIEL
ncbi:MAG: hypothetical protein M3Q32_13805 [Pseudomonadota bacterium]|nr:hypothetical protein [Burkholderiales bacterium]MDQ3197391.1 hypothetical protein [Pseudomonadota bacterium]